MAGGLLPGRAEHGPVIGCSLPVVGAGAAGLAVPLVTGAAPARPQPRYLLPAVLTASGSRGGAALAALAPVPEMEGRSPPQPGQDDQPGPGQPEAAGAQPGGQVPAVLLAARAGQGLVPGAGVRACTGRPYAGRARLPHHDEGVALVDLCASWVRSQDRPTAGQETRITRASGRARRRVRKRGLRWRRASNTDCRCGRGRSRPASSRSGR